MTEQTAQQVLTFLEADITEHDFTGVKPLHIDKWLAASVLQKSIRRNDLKTALSAALTLWHKEKNSFWRRLHTISVEDVGVASPDTITQTLTAFNNPAWRKKVGDLNAGLYLTRLLCSVTKIRLGDEIYTICNKSSDLQAFRQDISRWNDKALADYALNVNAPLPERTLCLWLLAGTKRFVSETLPKRAGSLEATVDVLLSLNAPADLIHACIGAINKTQWPLVLFTPLLWQETNKQQNSLKVYEQQYAVSPMVNGVPFVALDMFTRLGRSSFKQLRHKLPELQPFQIHQIGIAVFYSEGYCMNSRTTSDILEEYRQAGELADAQSAGLDVPEYLGLKEIIFQNIDLLNTLRQEELQKYFTPDTGKLPFMESVA